MGSDEEGKHRGLRIRIMWYMLSGIVLGWGRGTTINDECPLIR